jgi:ATP-dependent DNA helicase RecQ
VNGELLAHDGWIKALGEVRDTVRNAQRRAFKSLLALVEGKECVGRKIAHHYRISHDGGSLSTTPACRGCPACRRYPDTCPGTHPPEPSPLVPAPRSGKDPLAAWRGDNPSLFVWYDEGADVHPLLVRFAQRNVRVFAGLRSSDADKLQRAAVHTPIVLDDGASVLPLAETYEGPVAFVLADARFGAEISERARLGLVSYIVGPKTTPNPSKPGWLLRDTDASISAEALLGSM